MTLAQLLVGMEFAIFILTLISSIDMYQTSYEHGYVLRISLVTFGILTVTAVILGLFSYWMGLTAHAVMFFGNLLIVCVVYVVFQTAKLIERMKHHD